MKSMLALTPEQTQTVADVNLKYANRMEPIIKSSSNSLTKMFEMRKINNEKETELKRILSSQQWKNSTPLAMRCANSSKNESKNAQVRKNLAADR